MNARFGEPRRSEATPFQVQVNSRVLLTEIPVQSSPEHHPDGSAVSRRASSLLESAFYVKDIP